MLKTSVEYDDGKVPVFTNTKNPPPPSTDMGDNSGMILYSVLIILSLGAAIGFSARKRRENI